MMRKSIQSLYLCLLCGSFVAARNETGKVLPPQNLSVRWFNDFEQALFWDPPRHLPMKCSYFISVTAKEPIRNQTLSKPPRVTRHQPMQGGSMQWKIMTNCNGTRSDPVVYDVKYPDLVTDLECFSYSSQNARCQWSPVKPSPEIRFYYYLEYNCRQNSPQRVLRECESYNWTHGVRTGCELEATTCHSVYILFNATLNATLVRNTFRRLLMDDVRPPPLNLTVTKSGDKFNISWNLPDIRTPDDWKTEIKYTSCGVEHGPLILTETSEHQLVTSKNCQTKIAVRATSGTGKTPWSFWEDADEAVNPNMWEYAVMAVVPVLMAVVVALICVCFHKNKEKIFPKVPVPVNHLSEFMNNNDKSHFRDLYIPVNEEENCKISLVVDPQASYANC